MRFLTFPKFQEKNRLKSMLCLFLGGSAFFEFLILGRGKPFKIKGLQVFGRWRGYNSQNFENGGRGNINQPAREVCSAKKCSVKKGGQNRQIKKGNRAVLLYLYIIFIFIFIYQLMRTITFAYCIYYQPVQFFTADFELLFRM